MPSRQILRERQDVFYFDHKPSEINYGGKMRFQQAAFPAPGGRASDLETVIFRVLNRYAEILQAAPSRAEAPISDWKQTAGRDGARATGPETGDNSGFSGMADVFFDQWVETPRLNLDQFRGWLDTEVEQLSEAYLKHRVYAVMQEHATGIRRLNYFGLLALTTLIAEMVSDFFEKQIEHLGKMATTARFTLGRLLAEIFMALETGTQLAQVRERELGRAEPDEAGLRLLNPFVLGFNDLADAGMVEEVLSGPNHYQISHALRSQLKTVLSQLLKKSRRVEFGNLDRCLAEPFALKQLMQIRKERKRLLHVFRRNRDLRVKMIFENARSRLRQVLREYLLACPAGTEFQAYVNNERQMEEILSKPAAQKRFLKLLKKRPCHLAGAVKTVIREGCQQMKRGRREFFGKLSHRDLLWEVETILERFSRLNAQSEDFHLIRARYGRDTNRAINWQGIRIWRGQELGYQHQAQSVGKRLQLNSVWERRRAEIENNFAEGNIFLFRLSGEAYASVGRRSSKVIFLFADLRNSTETTMRLTKDTASYLAPYLTAVNSAALRCHGERIYFAGDGYAAYYRTPLDAIRAAYAITAQFIKLRKVSSDAHLREAKEIYHSAQSLGINLEKPEKIRSALDGAQAASLGKKAREFLEELSQCEEKEIPEDTLKRVLAKVAAAYTMPRVDIGVAMTSGELFYALVGDEREESEERIKIVISPQLAQSARLSGSSPEVKNYIETHYPQPLPFNVYTWEKKLYNRGVVITEDVFDQIRSETEVKTLNPESGPFRNEILHAYYDPKIKRRIIIRENRETVMLKGISQPCKVFEIATLGSPLEKKLIFPKS